MAKSGRKLDTDSSLRGHQALAWPDLGCDKIGGVADIDFALLDVPRDRAPQDADAYLRTAMAWHFGEDTGSRFWLDAAKSLDFDPLTDVTTFDELRQFPNLVDELRSVPVEH